MLLRATALEMDENNSPPYNYDSLYSYFYQTIIFDYSVTEKYSCFFKVQFEFTPSLSYSLRTSFFHFYRNFERIMVEIEISNLFPSMISSNSAFLITEFSKIRRKIHFFATPKILLTQNYTPPKRLKM